MSHLTPFSEMVELVVVQLHKDDDVEALPLREEIDRLACQRIRPAQRRRLFHFRRAAFFALLTRFRKGSTVLRDAAGHIRALLDAREASHVCTSASGAVCAVAFCDKPVGVDIERADGPVDLVSLLDFIAAPCATGLKSLPPDIAAFEARMAWTRIEARLKQVGRGIHDYIVGGPAILTEEQGETRVMAAIGWVCALTHAGGPIEIRARLIDFRTLCDE
ncbi:hypothetical protein [Hoeflea sp. IMCC20628]|uniref:hypothetical protein n=1 Tax=Hoeflea sp. IMCC20628 TaxID=1620421 RepID=UPI00063ABB6A|nr:hypothetical protein [Hoeflea sp. IMCC20628]